ncbi:hypothetical protein ACG0Z6_12510 [Roseateles sp. BYS180W]|uniref:Phosphoglycerate mutase n=1 Tax=Roseateles rivi TaxID=3299028 RepID=A0ABW7FXL6_9BURK
MHLLIPYAGVLGPSFQAAAATLSAPTLQALLGLLSPTTPAVADDPALEFALQLPHERVLAQAQGHSAPAALALAAGLPAQQPWGLLSPMHLAVGSDHMTALPPAALALDEAQSRAFFEALTWLMPDEEGWQRHWLSPYQWLVSHPGLAEVQAASLERVLNRNVDPWLPEQRLARRLLNEIQMALHGHPLNLAREAQGQLPLNSVWLSAFGASPATPHPNLPSPLLLDALREPALNSDPGAWLQAWQALDAAPELKQALDAARSGAALTLTLCGERRARSWQNTPRSALQRWWQRVSAAQPKLSALVEDL